MRPRLNARPLATRRFAAVRLAALSVALLAASLAPSTAGVLAGTDLPDLLITKTAAASVDAGSNVAFTITVSNLGPAVAYGTLYVGDQLPVGLTYVSVTGTGWSCANSGANVACQASPAAPLAVGAALPPIVVTAAVAASNPPATVRNCTSVWDGHTDPIQTEVTTANNYACVDVRVTAPAKGSLCVTKFNDLDADGTKAANEPFLAGWVFTLTNAASGASTKLTSESSGRTCSDVPAGSYTVGEALLPGWRQTYPATVGPQSVTVAAGGLTTVTFGNTRERCCLDFAFPAGRKDNFSVTDGTGAEASVAAPTATPATTTTAVAVFDWSVVNRSFTNRIALPTGNCISAARFEIRVKPLRDTPQDDTITLKIPGTGGATWAKTLTALSSAASPAYAWTTGKAPRTYTWNLGGMPLGGASLINALNAKRVLDTYVKDDTSVDYLRLTVTFCECAATSPK